MRAFLAVTVALLFAASGLAEASSYSTSGSYLVGKPFGFGCILPTDGIDSSCVDIPGGLGGQTFVVTATDTARVAIAVTACFYTGSGSSLDCHTGDCNIVLVPFCRVEGTVPSGAEFAEIHTIGGALIQWTLTIG